MSTLIRLGVVTGLNFEADIVRRCAARESLADRVAVATGIGRDHARAAAQRLAASGVAGLLSFGIAGGLDPQLACATVVVATSIRADGLPVRQCAPDWTVRLGEILSAASPLLRGDLAYAPAVLSTASEKARIFAATGALAADMESYGVAEAASAAGLPFASVRVVADTAGEEVPDIALQAMSPDGRLKLADTLGRIARRPQQVPGLLRLGRSTARARARLEAIAALGAAQMFAVAGG